MVFAYLLLALSGLALVCWSLPAAHRLKSPLDALAALGFLVGIVAVLLGAMLVAVPGFFAG